MKFVQWLLDNLFVVLIIAGVLSQLLQAIRGKKNPDEEADAPPREYEFEDPELAERTRRIREDIQRRIAERRRAAGGAAPAAEPPPAYEPAPAAYEEPPLVREIEFPPVPPPRPAHASSYDSRRAAEILEQQAALAERLRQAEELKAAAARRVAFEAQIASTETRKRQESGGTLIHELRNPEALRRAFVLREILGPPVGLR